MNTRTRNLITAFFLGMSAFQPAAEAQLLLDNSQTASALVQNVLLGGGVAVSNITFNGMPGNAVYDQLAAFNSANANVAIGNGVFMATGGTDVALGPNYLEDAAVPLWSSYSDGDLQNLAGGSEIFDAAVLEFDFVPSGNQVSFNFVFASEEYLEFVDQYNDVFGFFLSGPGISGAQNIALIPGTSTAISINTLNDQDYSNYYVDNGDGNTFPYNSDDSYIQFDGFTTPITASATVQCGQQYHIKLAVGDALDPLYDSGVFLQADAFSSPVMDLSVTPDLNLPCAGSVDLSILGVTGGIAPYDYEWSQNGTVITTGQMITVGQGENGTYTATVTDGCGSSVQEQVVVGAPVSPPINLVLTPDLNLPCIGDADITVVSISGGTAPFTYAWSLNGTTLVAGTDHTVPAGMPGTYTMTVNDDCAGTTQGTVVVGAPQSPAMTLDLTADQNMPCTTDLEIGLLGLTGGTAPFTYVWSLNGTTVGTGTEYIVPAGTSGTYTLTVNDNCGGSMQGTVVLGPPTSPPMTLNVTPDFSMNCLGTAALSCAVVVGGTAPFTYSWTLNGAVVGTAAMLDVTAAAPGIYTVTVLDNCSGSQTGTVNVTIDPPAALDLSVTPDPSVPCQGEIDLTVLTVSGGVAPYSYQWSTNGNTVASVQTIQLENGDQGNYTATVTDACGGSGNATVIVSPPAVDPIDVVLTDDVTVPCIGDIAVLTAISTTGGDGQYTYTWSDASGALLVNGITLNTPVTEEAMYTMYVTDNCNGSATAVMAVHAPQPLHVNLPNTVFACEGGSAELHAMPTGGSGAGTYTYLWSEGNGTEEIYTVFPEADTSFTVQVTDACGDMVSDEVRVRIQIPVVHITATNIEEDEFSLTAECNPNDASFMWTFSNGTGMPGSTVQHTFANGDPYWATVTATTTIGCTDVDSVFITPASQLFFPNAFTPDGDGINDLFGPVGYKLDELEFMIFDRWGEVIFTANGPDQQWNGQMANGRPAPTGVYVYKFRATGERLGIRDGIGSVTLLGQEVAGR